jgi:excisionase family DNA binding protein
MKLNQPRLAVDASGKLPKVRLAGKTVVDRNLYTINEARERLGGMSRSFIYTLITSGRLASIKISRRRFIPKDAIDAFVTGAAGARAPVRVQSMKSREPTFATLRLPSLRNDRRQ